MARLRINTNVKTMDDVRRALASLVNYIDGGGITSPLEIDEIHTNTILELTANNGVDLETVHLENGEVDAPSGLKGDTVSEHTSNAGVTTDGVKHKDGNIDMSAGDLDIIVGDNQANAFRLMENGNEILKAATTNGAELISLAYRLGFRNTATVAAAGAGANNSDAAAITAQITRVTGADGAKGVVLPANRTFGDLYLIYNDSATHLRVWAATGEQINGIAVGNYNTQGARNLCILVCIGVNAAGNQGWGAVTGTFS